MVAPVDHVLFGSEEVSVTAFPSQIVVEPEAEIVGIAETGMTVMVTALLVLEHPFALVCVTVYVPLVVALMFCVIPPVDHRFPLVYEDVNVTKDPWQIVVAPPAVMEGGAGFAMTFTTTGAEEGDAQPFPSM